MSSSVVLIQEIDPSLLPYFIWTVLSSIIILANLLENQPGNTHPSPIRFVVPQETTRQLLLVPYHTSCSCDHGKGKLLTLMATVAQVFCPTCPAEWPSLLVSLAAIHDSNYSFQPTISSSLHHHCLNRIFPSCSPIHPLQPPLALLPQHPNPILPPHDTTLPTVSHPTPKTDAHHTHPALPHQCLPTLPKYHRSRSRSRGRKE